MTPKDITELKKELNLIENKDIAYLQDDEDALKALFDEVKEIPQKPNLRLYMNDLKPDYDEDGRLTEKSYNEHSDRRTEFCNKVIDGYKFEDKYLYYDITKLKSIKTIKQINKTVETIKRLRKSKDFKPESLFNNILSDLNSLPEPIAINKIKAFKTSERTYIDIMDITKEREDTHKLDEDATLMINLTNYLETNYKPQQHSTGTVKEKETPTVDPETLSKLIEKKLINSDTHEWIGQKNLCAYFVDDYFSHLPNLWEVGKQIFKVNNLAQMKDNYITHNKGGKPRNHNIIDEIRNK